MRVQQKRQSGDSEAIFCRIQEKAMNWLCQKEKRWNDVHCGH